VADRADAYIYHQGGPEKREKTVRGWDLTAVVAFVRVRPFAEAMLLRVAYAYEQATRWYTHRAPAAE
jgi:hypothetical protein